MHRLYVEWFPAPLSSAVVASTICVLQNVFVIIIGTKGLVLDGYNLRRPGFVRWPRDCGVILVFRHLVPSQPVSATIKNRIY